MSTSQRLSKAVAEWRNSVIRPRHKNKEASSALSHPVQKPSRPHGTTQLERRDATSSTEQNTSLPEIRALTTSALENTNNNGPGELAFVYTSESDPDITQTSLNDETSAGLQQSANSSLGTEIEGASINHEKGQATECMKDTYQVQISSHEIYQFNHSDVWVAFESKLPLSTTLQAKWDDYKQDLDSNLQVVELKLIEKHQLKKSRTSRAPDPKKWRIISELRLSGKKEYQSQSVTISPCIWIFCGSKECRKEASRCIKDLEHPVQFSVQEPQVHVGGPVFRAAGAIVPLAQLPMAPGGLSEPLAQSGTIILHHFEAVDEGRTVESVCGTLCCSTLIRDGEILEQHFSRIGGLLNQIIGDYHQAFQGVAMTTAHGIFDRISLHEEQQELTDMEQYIDYTFWNTDLCDSDLDESEESSDDNEEEEDFFNLGREVLGKRDGSKVVQWRLFDGMVGVNFLGKLYSDGKLSGTSKSPADYALLRTKEFGSYSNRAYSSLDAAEITSFATNDELEQGPASVIFGLNDVAYGTTLPRAKKFPFNDGELMLRTIEFTKPLATGTSGAWLIKDAKFVGMIVAAYVGEPLALFMSAEDIIDDILVSFPVEANHPINVESCGVMVGNSQDTPPLRATATSSDPTVATRLEEALETGTEWTEWSKSDYHTSRPNAYSVTEQRIIGPNSTFPKFSHKGGSKKYEYQWVWTCCQCGDTGMSYNSTPGCPNCNIFRCANCPLQQVKVRVA